MKIMFAGASGVGKTTLAKEVPGMIKFDVSEYPPVLDFISGSVSDLIPKTKDMSHKEMLERDSKDLLMEDFQVMNLRNKMFRDRDRFVTDRSYLDLAAYFYYKQAKNVPKCEMEHFFETCKMLLNQQCTHLILLDFTTAMVKEWVMEDNGKRIENNYFQFLISSIMDNVLNLWGFLPTKEISSIYKTIFKNQLLEYGATEGVIKSLYGETKVLCIREANLDIRKKLIIDFLHE